MQFTKWFRRAGIMLLTALVASGLMYHLVLRNWCLHWGTTDAEAYAPLPGDDLFPSFHGQATRAITISASPDKVWLWLMQIGQDRSGFYSYTFLENTIGADMPKVERLVPEWKPRAVGETVWFATPKRFDGQGRMIAAVVQPQRSFVMVSPNDWKRLQAGGRAQEGLWSFTLKPLDNGQCRLIAVCVAATRRHSYQQQWAGFFGNQCTSSWNRRCCALSEISQNAGDCRRI